MAGKLAAIVTAAGASRRMGTHKALLSWQGEPLVAHQVETLHRAGFDSIVVVTGARAQAVRAATPDAATAVYNDEWQTGRSGSIEVGAAALPDEPSAILVVAVDQPLTPRILELLCEHVGEPMVQPVDPEGRPGHPVILDGGQLPALRDLEDEPEGLRSLVRDLRPDGVLVPIEDLPHWDLNNPEAYRRAVAES